MNSTSTRSKIDPDKKYSLEEVAQKELIPNVSGYQTVYQLTTEFAQKTDESGKVATKRVPVTETTNEKIKAGSATRPGSKISGKKFLLGSEIIKFLKLNGCG